jgi:RNA-binding protein 5/10
LCSYVPVEYRHVICSYFFLSSAAVPDVSTYTYEETSGYYYDASSGLYYDSKSQYYFNSSTNEYMYWSAEHNTYLPANSNATSASKQNEPEEDVVVDKKKVEKVKCAKKIAKDMEKWAKTLNQKKDKAAQPTASAPEPEKQKKPGREQNSFEDIAFSIMLKKPMPGSSLSSGTKNGGLAKLAVAGYGSDSEEEQPASSSSAAAVSKPGAEVPHTDWEKMACLLCKRQFPSKEKLIK